MRLETTYLVFAIIVLAIFLMTSVLVNQARTASPQAIAELSKNNDRLENIGHNVDSKFHSAKTGDTDLPSSETAILGTGCFWCTEAIFEELDGVFSVTPGYSGGKTEHPTYKEVCSGTTGHAEVVQIIYDPNQISFGTLLQAFWMSHDPTTLNRQGSDVGTQYRSVVFYQTESQKKLAELFKSKLNEANAFGNPVVTEITQFDRFYAAENYHQDYFAANGHAPYCQFVVKPKLAKFKKAFAEMQNYASN